MKLIKTLTYVVVLSLTFASYAEAKGRSFSGGFRSQRTATAPSRPVQQQTTQPLNMSKDLNTSTAQGNNFKAADGRNGTTDQAAAGSGWFRSGNTATQTIQPAGAMQSAAQPAVVRQGGGFLNNAMWFMLGSSLASHNSANVQTANQNGQAAVNPENTTADDSVVAPPVEEKESFFMSALRIVLWVAMLTGIYWLVKNLLQSKKNRANKKSDYTFGNN